MIKETLLPVTAEQLHLLLMMLTTRNDLISNNDEKYFDITTDGILSLKPQYRGKAPDTIYTYAVSDNGLNSAGSLAHLLPMRLIIPKTVSGIQVFGLQPGMFYFNYRVVELVLPNSIQSLPERFLDRAPNLRTVIWLGE